MVWRRLRDDAGRWLELPASPRRIVSLVPSVTELICGLGGAARLVGVTRFCSEPQEVVARLPRLGGTKTPARDAILALHPDLVVLNSEENRREDFDALVADGVPVFVSFVRTVEETIASVARLGTALDLDAAASGLAARIAAARQAVLAAVPQRVRVFCPIWRRPWMSFNRDTYCHDLLACAGGDNLCAAAAERYPTIELEAIAPLQPQVILLPDEPYPFAARHRAALGPLLDSPAGRSGRIYLVDGRALSWYGLRTPDALQRFAGLLGRAV
ncbi:MAG: helical backbone metal receptor [Deltaproteobacteria bacterium]|nr:helical backbone metal receptor [Deltaproteobacteria bacterium]